MAFSRTRKLMLGGTLLGGVLLLGYYTAYLLRDELRAWQRITVDFQDVGGLEAEDEVQVNGARMGRVASIAIYEDVQRVVLEVEPDLVIHEGHEITIEPLNPLGFVAVRIDPGSPDAPPVPPETTLQGRLALGLGQEGAPGPARREAFNRAISDMAGFTRDMLRPDSGLAGRLLADRDRARGLDEGLTQLARTWEGIDRQLASVAAGEGPGLLLASQDTALAVGETAGWLRGVLGRAETGLDGLERGQGLTGRLVADRDIGRSVREMLADQRRLWSSARRREGLLGGLHGPALAQALGDLGGRARQWTAEGEQGRGLLGTLSHPQYDPLADSVHALPQALDGLRRNPLVRSREARYAVIDGLGEVDDALNNLRRGVTLIRAGLPDRTSFQGALFAVF